MILLKYIKNNLECSRIFFTTNLSIAIAVSVATEAHNEKIVMNCANGHRIEGNTQRPNMKSVYVNGMENKAIKISLIDRFIRYFLSSGEERFPTIKTIIDTILPTNEKRDVNRYNAVNKYCFHESHASNGGNR